MSLLRSGAHVRYDSVGELSSGAHVFKVPFRCSGCLPGVRQALAPDGELAASMDLGPCILVKVQTLVVCRAVT